MKILRRCCVHSFIHSFMQFTQRFASLFALSSDGVWDLSSNKPYDHILQRDAGPSCALDSQLVCRNWVFCLHWGEIGLRQLRQLHKPHIGHADIGNSTYIPTILPSLKVHPNVVTVGSSTDVKILQYVHRRIVFRKIIWGFQNESWE